MDSCIGIDLGGTKIEVAVLDASGKVLLRQRCPTPQGDYAGTLEAIAGLVDAAQQALGPRMAPDAAVGVGIPGCMSIAQDVVRGANSTVLNGRPLRTDLARRLGRPVVIENDANCLAVSEAVDGAAAGARLVFAAILGTGVGAGIAIDGRALTGRNAIAGEWGHNPLPRPTPQETLGPPCWCGQHGCIETWVSGPGFEADHARAIQAGAASRPRSPDIIAAMRAGDAQARASFERYCDRLARSLAHVINILDPDAIVLGGGMSNVDELYDEVPRRLPAHVFLHHETLTTPLRRALHGDSSGVRGAAWLTRASQGAQASQAIRTARTGALYDYP